MVSTLKAYLTTAQKVKIFGAVTENSGGGHIEVKLHQEEKSGK